MNPQHSRNFRRLNAVRKKAAIVSSYSTLTRHEFHSLRSESFETISAVLVRNRVEGELPKLIACEFPDFAGFTWYPGIEPANATFASDLKFAIARIYSTRNKLEKLLQERQIFSELIIKGLYDDAKHLLAQVEQNFGTSLWLIEARLLVSEQAGGFSSLRDELKTLLARKPRHNVAFLAGLASQRVDRTIPAGEYNRRTAKILVSGNYSQAATGLGAYVAFLMRISNPAEDKMSLADAAYIVRGECCRPIIDCYDSVCRLLTVLVGHSDTVKDVKSCREVSKLLEISDPNNIRLRVAFGYGWTAHKYPSHVSPLTDFAAYKHLSTEVDSAEVDSSSTNSVLSDGLAATLQRATTDVLQHRGIFPLAIMELAKLGSMLGSTSLGYQVTGLAQQFFAKGTVPVRRLQLLTATSPLGFTFPLKPDSKLQAVAKNHQLDIEHPAVLSAHQSSLDSLTATELLVTAQDYICADRHHDALPLLTHLLNEQSSTPYIQSESMRGLFDCYCKSGTISQMADAIEGSRLSPLAIYYLVDVQRMISTYREEEASRRTPTSIAWPNVHLLAYAFDGIQRKVVYNSYVRFLRAHGFKRPHEILESNKVFDHSSLRFFLENVCTIEIMQSDWRAFSSLGDVEAERIAILHQLQNLEPELSTEHAQEISAIQQAIAIRQVRNVISESKIYFNIEGVLKSLPKELVDQFNIFRQFSSLPLHERLLPVQQLFNAAEKLTILVDGAYHHFATAFDSILETVLYSNEHGLDTFLSVRIRHQTLKGAIRSVFDKYNLIGEQSGDVYRGNSFWQEAFDLTPEQTEVINAVTADMSRKIDDVIDTASNKWVRIRRAGEFPAGWLDLTVHETELKQLMRDLQHHEHYEEFLNAAIAFITRRIEQALSIARINVKSQLEKLLLSRLEDFSSRLRSSGVSRLPDELYSAITKCSTELQHTLTLVAGWFQLQDNFALESFKLETLLQASIENVKNCFPSSKFFCVHDADPDTTLAGKHFPHLWDLFFLLLENVVRHSEITSDSTEIMCTVKDEQLVIIVRNRLPGDMDKLALGDKLCLLESSEPSLVRREHGSGLAKVRNILEFSLGVAASKSLKCMIVDESFTVSITLPLASIAYWSNP